MKKFLLTVMIIVWSVMVFAQQMVEKKLVKPIDLQGKEILKVDLSGMVATEVWSNDHAQIKINVKAYGINNQMLNALVSAGRYNINIDNDIDDIGISSPNLDKSITVRGKRLKDEVSYTVFVPSNVSVLLAGQEEVITGN